MLRFSWWVPWYNTQLTCSLDSRLRIFVSRGLGPDCSNHWLSITFSKIPLTVCSPKAVAHVLPLFPLWSSSQVSIIATTMFDHPGTEESSERYFSYTWFSLQRWHNFISAWVSTRWISAKLLQNYPRSRSFLLWCQTAFLMSVILLRFSLCYSSASQVAMPWLH